MARIDSGEVKTRADAPSVQPPRTTVADMTEGTPGVPSSFKGVLFGPPKTGKTTAACSGGKTLLVNFDPEGFATETLIGRKDITIVQPQSLVESNTLVKSIINGEADEYDFVVIDSVTFMFQKFGGKDILQTFIDGKDVRRAYGFAGAAAGQVINDLCMLPNTNVIFTAHLEKEYSDDDQGVTVDQDLGEHEVKLAVTPMVWKILGPAVGFIGRTWKEQVLNVDTGNTEDVFKVSFNDGSRSPVGSRYTMESEYEITDSLLSDLASGIL
jgi:hypothetical protein